MSFNRTWTSKTANTKRRVHRGPLPTAALAATAMFMVTAAGCGDGAVVAKGRVLVDGQPVSSGRLTLTPVGGGPRAFSLIDGDGAFLLRASTGEMGAYPGSYRVAFLQQLDPATRSQLARDLAGQLNVDKLAVSYRSPSDVLIDIPEAGDKDIVIDIRQDQGWIRSLSD